MVTLEQYERQRSEDLKRTGLKDIHGEEIRIGDTVRCEYLGPISEEIEETIVVKKITDLPWSFNCSQRWEIIEKGRVK